jgi:hypothetical protein
VRNYNACHGAGGKNLLVVSVLSGPLFRQPEVRRGCCYPEPHQAGHALAAVEERTLPHFLSSPALAHEGQVFPLLGERVQRVEMGKWAKAAGVLWALRQTPRRHPVTRPHGLTPVRSTGLMMTEAGFQDRSRMISFVVAGLIFLGTLIWCGVLTFFNWQSGAPPQMQFERTPPMVIGVILTLAVAATYWTGFPLPTAPLSAPSPPQQSDPPPASKQSHGSGIVVGMVSGT